MPTEKAIATRGRHSPSSASIAAPPALSEELTQEIHDLHSGAVIKQQASQMITAQNLTFAEGVGMIKALDLMGRFTGIARTKWFAERKETKDYKGASVSHDGKVITLRTFEDLCSTMNISRSQVDEDIQNLAKFGEEFLEHAQRMGLGYRDLRKLRALPEEERLVIEGSAIENSDDPEALKDLIEELAARNQKTKQELENTKADMAARDRVLAGKGQEIDNLKTELEKFKSPLRRDQEETGIVINAGIMRAISSETLQFMSAWSRFLAYVNAALEGESAANADTREQVEATLEYVMQQVANDLCERSIHMVDFKQQVIPAWIEEMHQQAATGTETTPDTEGVEE